MTNHKADTIMSQSIPAIVAQLDAIAKEMEKVSHIVRVMRDLIVASTEEKKCCGKCGDGDESGGMRVKLLNEREADGKPPEEPPYTAVGADELGDEPCAICDMVRCPHCAELHELRGAKDENGVESDLLLYYRCPQTDTAYLAGIGGLRLQR